MLVRFAELLSLTPSCIRLAQVGRSVGLVQVQRGKGILWEPYQMPLTSSTVALQDLYRQFYQ